MRPDRRQSRRSKTTISEAVSVNSDEDYSESVNIKHPSDEEYTPLPPVKQNSNLNKNRKNGAAGVTTTRQKRLLRCVKCDFKSESAISYKRHMVKHERNSVEVVSSDEDFIESVKSEVLSDQEDSWLSLATVKLENRDKKKYPCTQCDRKFKTLTLLQRHSIVHTEVRRYKCEFCKRRFKYEHNLKIHAVTHDESKVIKCAKCDFKCGSAAVLKQHMVKHEDYVYKCKICDKSFTSRAFFNQHTRLHSKLDVVTCEVCGKIFPLQSMLKKHMEAHIEIFKYRCDKCGKRYKQQRGLHRHEVEYHYGPTGRRHECGICGKGFLTPSSLHKHEKTHTKRILYCPLCPESFTETIFFTTHLESHNRQGSTLQEFSCKTCLQVFPTANMLNRHLVSHTEGLYNCLYCEYSCGGKAALTNHIIAFHSSREKETVERSEETVERSEETVQRLEEMEQSSEEMVQRSNETVQRSNKTRQRRPVQRSNKTVQRAKETVQRAKETVQSPNETVRRSRRCLKCAKLRPIKIDTETCWLVHKGKRPQIRLKRCKSRVTLKPKIIPEKPKSPPKSQSHVKSQFPPKSQVNIAPKPLLSPLNSQKLAKSHSPLELPLKSHASLASKPVLSTLKSQILLKSQSSLEAQSPPKSPAGSSPTSLLSSPLKTVLVPEKTDTCIGKVSKPNDLAPIEIAPLEDTSKKVPVETILEIKPAEDNVIQVDDDVIPVDDDVIAVDGDKDLKIVSVTAPVSVAQALQSAFPPSVAKECALTQNNVLPVVTQVSSPAGAPMSMFTVVNGQQQQPQNNILPMVTLGHNSPLNSSLAINSVMANQSQNMLPVAMVRRDHTVGGLLRPLSSSEPIAPAQALMPMSSAGGNQSGHTVLPAPMHMAAKDRRTDETTVLPVATVQRNPLQNSLLPVVSQASLTQNGAMSVISNNLAPQSAGMLMIDPRTGRISIIPHQQGTPVSVMLSNSTNQQPQNVILSNSANQQPQHVMLSSNAVQQPQNVMSSNNSDQLPQNVTSSNDQQPQNVTSSNSSDQQPQNVTSSNNSDQQPQNVMSSNNADKQPQNVMSSNNADQQPQNIMSSNNSDQQPENATTSNESNDQAGVQRKILPKPVKIIGVPIGVKVGVPIVAAALGPPTGQPFSLIPDLVPVRPVTLELEQTKHGSLIPVRSTPVSGGREVVRPHLNPQLQHLLRQPSLVQQLPLVQQQPIIVQQQPQPRKRSRKPKPKKPAEPQVISSDEEGRDPDDVPLNKVINIVPLGENGEPEPEIMLPNGMNHEDVKSPEECLLFLPSEKPVAEKIAIEFPFVTITEEMTTYLSDCSWIANETCIHGNTVNGLENLCVLYGFI